MTRVLVCGGRDYRDSARVRRVLDAVDRKYPISVVIQGGARGADALAKGWAQANGVHWVEYRAEWDKHGRSAGHIRNAEMLNHGKPDYVVAFPGGAGTRGMIELAKKAGVPTWVVGT
ncbi:MAG TPA: DUF2493 domain-containing protein [Acidimicrobiia bacterium]